MAPALPFIAALLLYALCVTLCNISLFREPYDLVGLSVYVFVNPVDSVPVPVAAPPCQKSRCGYDAGDDYVCDVHG